MPTRLDRLTTALSAALLLAALLACKKRTPVPTAPSAEVAASTGDAAPVVPPVPAPTAELKLGDVKRYADREKAQAGTARVLEDGAKVFGEADEKTAELTTLPKGLLVSRLASIPDWELIEFPSGLGKVSPGWMQAKLVDVKASAVDTAAKPVAAASASPVAPKSSASLVASAKPAASSTASTKPVASAAAAKAAADKAAADKAAADKAAARAARTAARAAAKAKAAAEQAAAGK